MEITYGRVKSALKVVIYGPEGIGKSTFASRFPETLFIDTEGSTKYMDVARLPKPDTWTQLLEEVDYVIQHPAVCKALVIDTADWAEQLCVSHICTKHKQPSIESFGYGKGYTYVSEEYAHLLRQLEQVIDAGIHVVQTAHAKMRKFEQPDEMGAYDRWEMKLSKNVAPLVKEWADMVLFANYKTITVKTDGKYKAQGGERVMYTTHHPCWDAKNRFGLEPEVRFTYESIRHCIEQDAKAEKSKPVPETKPTTMPPETSKPEDAAVDLSLAPPTQREPDIPKGIPKALADLMQENHVDALDIQVVVNDKGYYPIDMPITAYDPDFVQCVLIDAWPQVYAAVQENNKLIAF